IDSCAKRRTSKLLACADLCALDLEPDLDVAAGRMRIRTDLFVRLVDERDELRPGQALVLDVELDREAEPPAVARSDRHGAGHDRTLRVLLLLLGDIIERAAEASGVAGREQMLRRGGAGLARTAHLLGHGKIRSDRMVARLRVAVAAACGGRGGGEQRFDRHDVRSLAEPAMARCPRTIA